MNQYIPILFLLALGVVFAVASIAASRLLSVRQKPTAAKNAPYECGIVPSRESPQRFPVRFYLVAMIFVIFDIEIVFLFPWAVEYRALGTFGLVEVIVFSVVVFVALLYLVSNGGLSWGPVKRLQAGTPPRTSESTINRISAGPPPPQRVAEPPSPERAA